MKENSTLPLKDKLLNKIYAYFHTIWKEKWREGIDEEWLNNFMVAADGDAEEKERLNMLFLLSKFMYFGTDELRALILSLYRDLFKYPIIASIRQKNSDTIDTIFIEREFQKELSSTRFVGIGHPSDSGTHILLYLRQEAGLSSSQSFLENNNIFKVERNIKELADGTKRETRQIELCFTDVKRYIFIDDFCGSGTQAKFYLRKKVDRLRKLNPNLNIQYLVLFATENGLDQINDMNLFDNVQAVFTMDETFKSFSSNSRYFTSTIDQVEKAFAHSTAFKYGDALAPSIPLGYGDCQLLIGFSHNTPDNTLPIFWSEQGGWKAIFKRYIKTY